MSESDDSEIDVSDASETDVLVVGGGPGGYVAAIRAGQLGLDVTLVEREALGGTCLNVGCIPSKALITATNRVHGAENAEEMGISGDLDVDTATMNEWKDGVVDRLTGGVEQLCEGAGVTLVDGTAAFEDESTVGVDAESEDAPERISFEHAVVATGSRPIEVPGFEFDGERILSSRHALGVEDVPDRLVVVGAGYIGMELSGVYAKLGSEVTVVEMLDEALPGYEGDIAELVRERTEEVGVEFAFGQSAAGWEEDGDGIVVTTEDEDGDETEFEADACLVAVGREPVTDTVDPEAAGLEPDDDGFLPTDERGETEVDGVYAVGDVAGEPMLAHKGMHEGEVVAEAVAGEPAAMDYQAVPAVVFTDPEVGTVGMTEAEAEEAGYETVVGEVPLRTNGRALTLAETDGFVRVVADDEMGYLLGAQVVAPEASELIAELALAVEVGATLDDVAATIHTHPTLSEAVKEAAMAARGHAIHAPN